MKKIFALLPILFFLFPQTASAHEAYVLTRSEFQQGLKVFTPNPLSALLDPSYIGICLIISASIFSLFLLNFLIASSPFAFSFDKTFRKIRSIGPLITRIAISTSFFYAAMSSSILGPELSLNLIPYGNIVQITLFALSLMIFLGFFTEIAALAGIILFFYISQVFGLYMVTYSNYLGELLVLFLFGSKFLSVDLFLFGKKTWNKNLEKLRNLEIPIIRIMYGIALIYAGWTIKFAHQGLSIAVYNQYHLQNFFHASAGFIASGAGLSEILIGFFILIGFGQRLTILISLIFITLSLLYFREMLWPHLMLYGISFSLFINSSDEFTFDRYFVGFLKNKLWRSKK